MKKRRRGPRWVVLRFEAGHCARCKRLLAVGSRAVRVDRKLRWRTRAHGWIAGTYCPQACGPEILRLWEWEHPPAGGPHPAPDTTADPKPADYA